MSIITNTRELGSEGSLIGEKAAKALGYHLVDVTTIETILKGYGLVHFDHDYRSIPGVLERLSYNKGGERDDFIKMLNGSLLALANHGDLVILGRGGFAVFEGMVDVINVRIQAPLQLRIARIQESPAGADSGEAELAVKANDQVQKTFVKSVYGMQWDITDAFDLVIDTGKIKPELAASMIVEAARALQTPNPEEKPTAVAIEVDPVLASAVQAVLNCQLQHTIRNDSNALSVSKPN